MHFPVGLGIGIIAHLVWTLDTISSSHPPTCRCSLSDLRQFPHPSGLLSAHWILKRAPTHVPRVILPCSSLSLAPHPENSRYLKLPENSPQLWASSRFLLGSPTLRCKGILSRQQAGPFVRPISNFSWDLLLHIFCPVLTCFRQKEKSGPCYCILAGSGNSLC